MFEGLKDGIYERFYKEIKLLRNLIYKIKYFNEIVRLYTYIDATSSFLSNLKRNYNTFMLRILFKKI